MAFTQIEFLVLFAIVFVAYWAIRDRRQQNVLLLVASYVFYGWVHPWFVVLLGGQSLVNFAIVRSIPKVQKQKKLLLVISLIFNLGILGYFKYFNFFLDSIRSVAQTLDISWNLTSLDILLPIGISFYTFQLLSYTVDIYRGLVEPAESLLDFGLFIAFFPQLVAGPIERATHLFPQIVNARKWSWERFIEGWQLVIQGLLLKVMVADSVAIYVNQIFMLQRPSLTLLGVGCLAFAVQIYADFEGYTQMARGFAKLIGFDLVQNFNSPYLAVSPSDFWDRWHITLSHWLRDYIFFPLRRAIRQSRPKSVGLAYLVPPILTLLASGLWHGAAWHFVLWGLYHGILLYVYSLLGFSGQWRPSSTLGIWLARATMFGFTLFGWLLFRAPSISWLAAVFENIAVFSFIEVKITTVVVLCLTLFYSIPILAFRYINRAKDREAPLTALAYALATIFILIYFGSGSQDFIYFQF